MFQLGRIHADGPEVTAQCCGDIDVLAHDPAQQSVETMNHGIRIEYRVLHHLFATHGKDLFGEIGAAHCQCTDLMDIGAHRIVIGDHAEGQIAVAQHAGEEVAEVVRDPAGKGADRFHLLRLP